MLTGRVRRVLRGAPAVMAAMLGALTLSGCRTDVEVFVRSTLEGSGVVRVTARLDDDAAKAIGPTSSAVAARDLVTNGWAVAGARPGANGGVSIEAEKAFASPAQANQVLKQLSGPDGPLPTIVIERSRNAVRRRVSIHGSADLRQGLSAFGDAQLKALLGSSSGLGIGDDEVARQAGTSLARAFHFRVSAQLGQAPMRRWDVPIGQRVAFTTSSQAWAGGTIASMAALVLGLAGLGFVVLRGRRRHP